jgi:hypothetical protein
VRFGQGLAARRVGASDDQRGRLEAVLDPETDDAQGAAGEDDGQQHGHGPAPAAAPGAARAVVRGAGSAQPRQPTSVPHPRTSLRQPSG